MTNFFVIKRINSAYDAALTKDVGWLSSEIAVVALDLLVETIESSRLKG